MTTDIWGWVHDTHRQLAESGQHRLATALAEIAGHAVEGRNEQLDAMYPEALASARALGLPWVEVFLRHWRLQNLLNKRHQGEAAMAEAVSLLEFAHREETASCPQSVCAVQDFTICHANIDGPGYVPERLAVLEETLQRVEPARACFDCLSREYADTLEDDDRSEEALGHLDRAQARIQAAGEQVSLAFGHSRASALHRLGRYQDALAAYDTAEHAHVAGRNRLDDDDRRKLAAGRALNLAALGRTDTALELLPPPRRPTSTPTSGTAGPAPSNSSPRPARCRTAHSPTTPNSAPCWPAGSATSTPPARTAPASTCCWPPAASPSPAAPGRSHSPWSPPASASSPRCAAPTASPTGWRT